MAAETPVLYNVETWVEENQKYFLPPVCNKMMHNTQLKVRSKFYIPSTIKSLPEISISIPIERPCTVDTGHFFHQA